MLSGVIPTPWIERPWIQNFFNQGKRWRRKRYHNESQITSITRFIHSIIFHCLEITKDTDPSSHQYCTYIHCIKDSIETFKKIKPRNQMPPLRFVGCSSVYIFSFTISDSRFYILLIFHFTLRGSLIRFSLARSVVQSFGLYSISHSHASRSRQNLHTATACYRLWC